MQSNENVCPPRRSSPQKTYFCIFDVTNHVPTQSLRSVIGIDQFLVLIDWYEGGNVQCVEKSGLRMGIALDNVLSIGGIKIVPQLKI